MKQLLRIFLLMLIVCCLLPDGRAFAACDQDCQDETAPSLTAEDLSAIQAPEQLPLFLFNNENTGVETIASNLRFQFLSIHPNRLVPRNFCFRNDIRLTFYLIDHEAPVPVFIRGHALRR